MNNWKNQLFFGDNLHILRDHVADESVDLIYLDPPFNSAANYNVLFQEKSGAQSAAQITAFEDTWKWSQEAEGAYHETVTGAPERVVRIMEALRGFLGTSDMMAYLTRRGTRALRSRRRPERRRQRGSPRAPRSLSVSVVGGRARRRSSRARQEEGQRHGH